MKKLLYQIHRWAGIALAVVMLIWFSSGWVIMYAAPSALGPTEQLERQEPLQAQSNWLSLGEAWSRSAAQRAPGRHIVSARLVRQAGHPVWLVNDDQEQHLALSALDGSLRQTSVDEATLIARHWVAQDNAPDERNAPIRHVDTRPQDSSVRNHAALRPFHRLGVGDGGRELLISARTGEVVRDTTPLARSLYWVGNWIHLLRPMEGLGWNNSRRDVLTWLSFFAMAASITGLIIGWQRWRPGWGGRPTYSQGRVHPYRDAWNTWHFWAGLIGGTAALLWAFSGYLNNNPGQIFSPATASKSELRRYQGTDPWPAAALNWRPGTADGIGHGAHIVALSWHRLGSLVTLVATDRQGTRTYHPVTGTVERFDPAAVLAAVRRLQPQVGVASHALQTDYDSYYYPRHRHTQVDRPLPVLRVDLADDAGTRLYIDPQAGDLLLKQDRSRRAYRWLYSALHHWDFGWIYWRPVWDAWMLTWVVMGVTLAATSVVLGVKRLQLEFKTFRKKARKKTASHASSSEGSPETSQRPAHHQTA